MKTGKKPARPDAVKFRLRDFVNPAALPKPPRTFGHEDHIGRADWGMLGNDTAGDCVFAGACHETMLWCSEAGIKTRFTAENALADYAALTGFDPAKPETDNGTDMTEAASYRRKTGIVDAGGKRHTIAAYLKIDPGNLTEHYQALYLFGAVGIGILFPDYAMDQFDAGKPWTLRRVPTPQDGHYIPLVAKRSHIECVTWGQAQPMTAGFFGAFNDESLAYVSLDGLVNNKSPEGFDAAGLIAALGKVKPGAHPVTSEAS